jgi:ribosomal-protein-alanine N-acetyltransferase
LGLNEIVGRELKANKASIHILEKIGMTFRRELDFDGKEGVWFSITKQEYLSKL